MPPKTSLSGKIQTVLGPIEPELLGVTLTHEHIMCDCSCYFEMPDEASLRTLVDAPVTMENLRLIPGLFRFNKDNQRLWDVEVAIEELLAFKYAGGGSLVDVSNIGLARDPLALARISRATNLNIIMGGSYYVSESYPEDMDDLTEDQIAEQIIDDITVGVGVTTIKSGLIGEIGNRWPPIANEKKVLRASARAQIETGAPILIHPGFHLNSPGHILDILDEAGADISRVVMGHLDLIPGRNLTRELIKYGCFMEYDVFGMETTQIMDASDPTIYLQSDVQRIEMIKFIFEQGAGDRLVIAQDTFFKWQMSRYGGKGYAHIIENIVPRMLKRGFTRENIKTILVDNPKKILTFA